MKIENSRCHCPELSHDWTVAGCQDGQPVGSVELIDMSDTMSGHGSGRVSNLPHCCTEVP